MCTLQFLCLGDSSHPPSTLPTTGTHTELTMTTKIQQSCEMGVDTHNFQLRQSRPAEGAGPRVQGWQVMNEPHSTSQWHPYYEQVTHSCFCHWLWPTFLNIVALYFASLKLGYAESFIFLHCYKMVIFLEAMKSMLKSKYAYLSQRKFLFEVENNLLKVLSRN